MKDLKNNTSLSVSLDAGVYLDDAGAVVPDAMVDKQNYESVLAEVTIGDHDLTAGTIIAQVYHGDLANGSDKALVAGATETATFAAGPTVDKRVMRIVYSGTKRYVGVGITVAATGTSAVVAGNILLGHPRYGGQTQFS